MLLPYRAVLLTVVFRLSVRLSVYAIHSCTTDGKVAETSIICWNYSAWLAGSRSDQTKHQDSDTYLHQFSTP